MFIAEPLDKEILEQRKRGLQKIYSGLSPFASTQLSYGENYSKAVSKGMSENFSKTLNDSLTDTTSHFNSRSTSRSHGTSFGFWVSVLITAPLPDIVPVAPGQVQ